MSVCLYRRVSSTSQKLDRQEVGADVDRVFEEKLTAAKGATRPALEQCLEYLRPGDTLRFHAVDRAARSLGDLITIVDRALAKGARVEVEAEGLVLDPADPNPQAELQLQLWGAFAQYERAISKQRQAEGIALAKARGAYKGRAPKLSPAEVRSARERRALGVPLARLVRDYGCSKMTIAAALNGTGVYGEGEYATH